MKQNVDKIFTIFLKFHIYSAAKNLIGRRFYFMFGTKQLIEVYDGRQIYSTFAKADGKSPDGHFLTEPY